MHKIGQSWLIALILTTGGCAANQTDDRDAIAVSFEPQAWIAEKIAGDDLDIITLLPAGSDPEVYQPSISTMKNLGKAKAYLTLGTSGFEESVIQNITRNFPQLKIVDSSKGIEKLYGSHGSDKDLNSKGKTDFDPHIMTSVRNCIMIADNIAKTLAETYPEKASKYIAAGQTLKEKLREYDDSISKMNLEGRSIVIRHPSLSYFARDYGVGQISLSDAGKEMSPLQMRQRIEATSRVNPMIMVVEKEHESSSDYDTARQLGIDTIQVALNTASWIKDLMRISHEIDRD